jgi:glycosyltransferase involved in cell wall biosynthesis
VVITQTEGQVDVVEDRRAVVRGANLLRSLAAREGVALEPNGFYVPPGDAAALRRAIVYLLDHPEVRAQLGTAGRHAVERLMTVDQYAQRVRTLVEQACAAPAATEGQTPRAPARGAALRAEEPAT